MTNQLRLFSLFLALLFLLSCGSGGGNNSQQPPDTSEPKVEDPAQEQGLYPNYNTSPLPADSAGMTLDAVALSAQISIGWNAGNTMEAIGGETAWGNPHIDAELIQMVKSAGFNAIRLPLSWDQYADQDSAKISEQWLQRVEQVVEICIDNDMYVIVNIHWDGGWLEENNTPSAQDDNNAKQKAFWQQIATTLRDFDQRLLFASANEPHVDSQEQMSVLHSYHQTFVDAVRETGGKNAYRNLILQGPATDIEKTVALWQQMPSDTVANRQMMEVHFYSPYNFTLMKQDESWGNQFYYWGEGNHSSMDIAHNPTWGEEQELQALFEQIRTSFVDKGIPVIVGEYGAIKRDDLTGDALALHRQSRADYLEFVTYQQKLNSLVPFYWDNGADFSLFNRQQNQVSDQIALDALMQGVQRVSQSN